MDDDFAARLAVGDDVTVDERDVEMLAAIDREGSMHAAAERLGRSYPHMQRRLDDLEAAAGDLTDRARGGTGGGGTTLTDDGRTVVRRFSRLQAELSGAASVTESVFPGTVVDRDGEIASVETDAGTVAAVTPPDASTVEVTVRSDAVALGRPGGVDPDDTSLRNDLAGTVSEVDAGDAVVAVTVELDGGPALHALVTEASRDRLDLAAGRRVVARFKATATRAVPVDPARQ
jgi:molybdate transport system regulatory protein